jgi:ketosteroid isomerase-like protein
LKSASWPAESHLRYFVDLYDAFNRRDADAVLAVMTDDVQWPNAWKGGRLTGRDAVREYWRAQWAEIDPRVEPLSVEPRADGGVAVTVRQTVRSRDGALLSDQTVIHVYALRGELIARMHVEAAPAR